MTAVRVRRNGRPLFYDDPTGIDLRINGRPDLINRIMATGPSIYTPIFDGVGSTVVKDISGNGFNGTPANVVLGVSGIGDGRTAGSFNGTTSVITLPHTAMRAVFDKDVGSVLCWVSDPDWAGGNQFFVNLGINSNNQVLIHKGGGADQWRAEYRGGGTVKQAADNVAPSGYFSSLLTWDTTADEAIGYRDNVLIETMTSLGTWVGGNNINFALIGTNSVGAADLDGVAAHVAYWPRVLTDSERASVMIL